MLLATKLAGSRDNVTLIDKCPTHIWKPMLHTIAAGTRDVQQQQVIFLAHAKEHGYTYQPGEMIELDRVQRLVHLGAITMPDGTLVLEPRSVGYDVLVLALGSQVNDFDVPGVKKNCYLLDCQPQAETFNAALRARAFRSVAGDEGLRVAIVGGGATGAELAAELSRLLEIASAYGDPSVRDRLQLTLLESGPRILGAFPPAISVSSQQRLEQLGLAVKTSTRVTGATADGFSYDGSAFVDADLMVWAAGVKASDFLRELSGIETNRAGQIVVRQSLQSASDQRIFALGDCASLTPSGGQRPLPPTAQVAIQQAEHLARRLPGWLSGKALPDFVFRDFGSLVSLRGVNRMTFAGIASI